MSVGADGTLSGPASTAWVSVKNSLLWPSSSNTCGSLPHPWNAPYAMRPLRTMAVPRGLVKTRLIHFLLMFQSSVISWSSQIMYDGTLASARATRGTASRKRSV